MSKNTTEKVSGHDAVIAKVKANAAAEQKGWQDAMQNAITLMIAVYAVIKAEVFIPSGLPESEWATLRGGKYWGMACGKKETAFTYKGNPENYPSQGYLSHLFALKYMHTAERLAEFRRTNVAHQVKHYVQWLSIMYGWKLDHCKLERAEETTMAKWKTVKGTAEQRADGRQFASCVLKEVSRADSTTLPKDLRKAFSDVTAMTTPKEWREVIGQWDVGGYTQSDLLSLISAMTAQWLLNEEATKVKEASDKRRAKQTT